MHRAALSEFQTTSQIKGNIPPTLKSVIEVTQAFVSRLARKWLTLTLVSSRGLVLAFQLFHSRLRHEVCYVLLQVIYATAHVVEFTGLKDHNCTLVAVGLFFRIIFFLFWGLLLMLCSNTNGHLKCIFQIPLVNIHKNICTSVAYSAYLTLKKGYFFQLFGQTWFETCPAFAEAMSAPNRKEKRNLFYFHCRGCFST